MDSGLDKFNELVQLADLGEHYFSNKTIFAPSNRALGEMPAEVLEGYKTDSSGLKGRTELSVDFFSQFVFGFGPDFIIFERIFN